MTGRAKIARVINFLGVIATLFVAWQAVRFCQGHIGAPGIDQLTAMLYGTAGPPAVADTANGVEWASAGLFRVYYYLAGIAVWLILGVIVSGLLESTARIVEVGFHQYMAECKEAHLESQRWARIRADRERRGDQRRKIVEAQQPKLSFGWGALVLGIVIGKIL